jgi:MraZ protein
VDQRGVFRGFALQAVDAKGRVAIPHGLRTTIERNSQVKTVVIAKHEIDQCLTGYDRDYTPPPAVDQDGRGLSGANRYNASRVAFGLTDDANYDDSGRCVIPPMLRKLGKIENLAFFLGAGDTFEIWNPKIALESPDVVEDVKAIIRFCLEEKGITLEGAEAKA